MGIFEDYPASFARGVIPHFSRVLDRVQGRGIPIQEGYIVCQLHRFLMDMYLLSLSTHGREDHILDVGCGSGIVGMVLKEMGFTSVLLADLPGYNVTDFSSRAQYLPLFGLRLESCDVMMEALPVPSGSVDVVSFLDVIEHLHGSPRFFLKETHRVLKPGGRLIITTPNAVSLRHRLAVPAGVTNYVKMRAFYESGYPYHGHVREYTMQDLRYAVERSGFLTSRTFCYNDFSKDLYVRRDGRIGRKSCREFVGRSSILRVFLWAATKVSKRTGDSLAIIAVKS